MNRSVADKRNELTRLCRKFCVRRLELFGSAARDDFDTDKSNLDFLVEFDEMPPAEYADAYFGLLAALEDLFKRPLDLVVLSALHNRCLLKAIEHSRTLLYAA